MRQQGFATRANLEYIEQLYQQFQKNPQALTTEWRMFFEGVEFAQDATLGLSDKELNVYDLITAYRNYGHFEADLDPLANSAGPSDQLTLQKYHLKESDLDQAFNIGAICGKPNATLREIIAHLRACYCGKITVQCAEAMPEIRDWFIREFEQDKVKWKISPEEKKEIFHSVTKTESLEKFLHTRYVGVKRFSIEGGDSLIPMLETLVKKSTALKNEEIMIGMAHRGRINVLANFMGKALEFIFSEIDGNIELEEAIDAFDGDVKYHLGYSCVKNTPHGPCSVTLAFNPSHLEAVNPVVIGMARAAQRRRQDTKERKKVIPLLIHGDAAFAGQGVVAETFQMSQVKGYTVGGTIHLVVDNQVGFTTSPENGRSSHYSSDIAKCLFTPVLHVNGDDVESCVRAMDIALRFRQEYGRDVVVNICCYRRFGHNEGDEPAFTQPQMYELISKHATLREIYGRQLIRENVIDQKTYENLYEEKINNLQKILDDTRKNPPKVPSFKFEGWWKGLRRAKSEDFNQSADTTFPLEKLREIGHLIGQVPAGFNPHPKLLKLLENRRKMADGKELLDWGTAELLAYGSLLTEGTSVRLTGQDCVRGTFSHRHSCFYDVKTGEAYCALDTINGDKVEFCVYDSILSEYGVLGFEYGNAICDPTFLTLWEAQYGDFSNGAQIIIDQFLVSGESKWQQMNGLVLLLPHGYEGGGPEHSSARLERFLQMAAQNNIQVCNLTTPAQIYHALRRQIRRPFRKPLIVMSPKVLLRHPKAKSTLEDLALGTFKEVLPDTTQEAKGVENIVLCSGKVYYELLEEREKQKEMGKKTALVRVEQLYPFPEKGLTDVLKTYPKAKVLTWAQEEPKNMGSWTFFYFHMEALLEKLGMTKLDFRYVGRTERASPATGSPVKHKLEQQALLEAAFKI